MKQARSPRYPAISLPEALQKAGQIYAADYQNKIPKSLIAEHMGYASLNGKSLGVISALSKYGLLEGRSDEVWITDRALAAIVHGAGSTERIEAIKAAAQEPELFKDLDSNFPGKVSDAALRSYLLGKRKFLPDAADRAIRSYRETSEFVETETAGLRPGHEESEWASEQTENPQIQPRGHHTEYAAPRPPQAPEATPVGTRREVFGLEEGDVVLTYPESISKESFEDLLSYFRIFIRKAKRRADKSVGGAFNEFDRYLTEQEENESPPW
ncbi:hypothetical protein [Inquilinus sp. CAU 1745]|uniref:hypothetical protein n=1 Tax=Inquilinus sp. CAU 1745 TaxID=3140369 RepID=UPI00325B85B1